MPSEAHDLPPIKLLGLAFDAGGWRSRLPPWRGVSWGDVRELEISLQSRWRRFGYRLELVDCRGRSIVLRIRGGLTSFRKLVRILEMAQARNRSMVVRVFSKDILEYADLDRDCFLEEDELPPYDLVKRARFCLMALEYDRALADAQSLIEESPRHENPGRTLRLKALLLKGAMRRARRELAFMADEKGEIDPEARAQYAIVALYRGRREGVAMARKLIEDGRVECVELVGLEFSRYLADRSRFKEAMKVLRMAENRTRLVDPNLFKALQAARGEVLSKKDYRFYRYIGVLFKSRARWGAIAAIYIGLLLYVIWPEEDSFEEVDRAVQLAFDLEQSGRKGFLDADSIVVQSQSKGLTRLGYAFYQSVEDAESGMAAVRGSAPVFTPEARRLISDPSHSYVLYLPFDADQNQLAPMKASRWMAHWYEAFDKHEELLALLVAGLGVFAVGVGRRMLS